MARRRPYILNETEKKKWDYNYKYYKPITFEEAVRQGRIIDHWTNRTGKTVGTIKKKVFQKEKQKKKAAAKLRRQREGPVSHLD